MYRALEPPSVMNKYNMLEGASSDGKKPEVKNTKCPDSHPPGLALQEACLLLMENDTTQPFSNIEKLTFFLNYRNK